MSIHFDFKAKAWRWQFKATVDGHRCRFSRILPAAWSETQSRKFDEQETAKTYARLSLGPIKSEPVEAAVKLYLDEHVPTLRDARTAVSALAKLLPFYKGRQLSELPDIARKVVKHSRVGPTTTRQRLAYLKAAANYALRHSLGSVDYIKGMALPSPADGLDEYLTRREVILLARACKDKFTRALILAVFYTGQRPGELYRADAVTDGWLLPMTKNGTRFKAIALPHIRWCLAYWPMPYDYTVYSRHFRKAREAIGRPTVHLHTLRHSAASALISKGRTLSEVAGVLNHKSIQATQRYAHLYDSARILALKDLRKSTAAETAPKHVLPARKAKGL
jgi:integrase